MSEKSSKDVKRFWMRPIKGKWRSQHHLLLWPIEEVAGRRVKAAAVRACYIYLDKDNEAAVTDDLMVVGQTVDDAIEASHHGKGTLTIWIPGGWDHLVLTGLAGLIDQGVITWRYCLLDTNRVLIRGLWRGKSIIITSLANWTGNTWDAWAGKTEATGYDLFKESWLGAARLSHTLTLGALAPSAGAAGMLWWRRSAGPRVEVLERGKGGVPQRSTKAKQVYVAPIPSRPQKCRNAERHAAYGLVHRQMREGLVEGPVYVVDLRQAYLAGLLTAPIPVMFSEMLHQPTADELSSKLDAHTGVALVQLNTADRAYPMRRRGAISWARGQFWTWLAGTELATALCFSQIQSCKCAYLWSAFRVHNAMATLSLSVADAFEEDGHRLMGCAWRSLYSHLVGRFAAWRRRWVDTTATHSFGRWASWHGINPETGEPVSYRSVAGRVQKLQSREDAGNSVPLLFGCVTAQVRAVLGTVAELCGYQNVLAIEADALWLGPEGMDRLLASGGNSGSLSAALRAKEVFDKAWLTGDALAVVEMDGKRFVRCPGVPADIAVGPHSTVNWELGQSWHEEQRPDAAAGVKRYPRRYSVASIIKTCSHEPRVLSYADDVHDLLCPEELMQPLGSDQTEAEHGK